MATDINNTSGGSIAQPVSTDKVAPKQPAPVQPPATPQQSVSIQPPVAPQPTAQPVPQPAPQRVAAPLFAARVEPQITPAAAPQPQQVQQPQQGHQPQQTQQSQQAQQVRQVQQPTVPATPGKPAEPKLPVADAPSSKGPQLFGYKPPKWAANHEHVRSNKGKGQESDTNTWLLYLVDRMLKMHSTTK